MSPAWRAPVTDSPSAPGLAALDAVLKLLSCRRPRGLRRECLRWHAIGSWTQVYARLGLQFTFVDMRDSGSIERGHHAGDPDGLLRDADQPDDVPGRPGGHRRPHLSPRPAARGGQHLRHPVLPAAAGARAPTSCCIRRPSTSTATATWSAALRGHQPRRPGRAARIPAERLRRVPGPMDCWLALRGTKTLPLRMRQHDANGRRIADWLERAPQGVRSCTTPACPSHPQHELACRQMSRIRRHDLARPGRPRPSPPDRGAHQDLPLAESLGGVESLIGHPASMTHASVPTPMREAMGLTDSLIRLSCGIEEAEDLMADLEQALLRLGRSDAGRGQTGRRAVRMFLGLERRTSNRPEPPSRRAADPEPPAVSRRVVQYETGLHTAYGATLSTSESTMTATLSRAAAHLSRDRRGLLGASRRPGRPAVAPRRTRLRRGGPEDPGPAGWRARHPPAVPGQRGAGGSHPVPQARGPPTSRCARPSTGPRSRSCTSPRRRSSTPEPTASTSHSSCSTPPPSSCWTTTRSGSCWPTRWGTSSAGTRSTEPSPRSCSR